ncbi:MAG TPA: hypothetical protein VFV22_02890 [Candidatus Paceibacterota bacterium]|nr:hypothetical protein [Candidatus Paceibacterota bacterium]
MKKVTRKSLILAVVSLACSRATFMLIDDPEGPNLLIVVVLAGVIYFLASIIFLILSKL